MGTWHGMGWGMGFGWFVPLLVIGGIVWFLAARGRSSEEENRAEAILRERFARGEIDEAEYLRLRKLLRE